VPMESGVLGSIETCTIPGTSHQDSRARRTYKKSLWRYDDGRDSFSWVHAS